MKLSRVFALAACLSIAVAPKTFGVAFEQRLNITLTGSYQGLSTNLAFGIITPAAQAVRVNSVNMIQSMAYDLGPAGTNFFRGTILVLRSEIVTNNVSTNLNQGVFLRRGTNIADVSRFFTNSISSELLPPVGPDLITNSVTGAGLNTSGLRLLSFNTTNLSFTVSGYDVTHSLKLPQIGTNFLNIVSGSGIGTFDLNIGQVVSNTVLIYTNVVVNPDLSLTITTNYVSNVLQRVSGPAHAIINIGGPVLRQ